MLWGSHAQKKGRIINTERHYILKAPHPSPLSAHRGFLGCKHFSQANQLLQQQISSLLIGNLSCQRWSKSPFRSQPHLLSQDVVCNLTPPSAAVRLLEDQ